MKGKNQSVRQLRTASCPTEGGVVTNSRVETNQHPLPLFDYQIAGAAFLAYHDSRVVFLRDGMGLGKTAMAVVAFDLMDWEAEEASQDGSEGATP
jgi:SNF2 family DNA or RNA helicase